MIKLKLPYSSLILLFVLITTACSSDKEIVRDNESTIYFGGDILTMESDKPVYVESLVIQSGIIVFTGSLEQANNKFPNAKKSDLNGETLMPGFIDGHCHFAGFPGQSVGAQILPPPDATVKGCSIISCNCRTRRNIYCTAT